MNIIMWERINSNDAFEAVTILLVFPYKDCRVALQYGPGRNTAYKLYTFSNIMVGKKSSRTPNILYAARRDCHATP